MPSRRMIDPAFWQSETVAALPIDVRYFFIGLFSNADDQGRMKAHPALIRSKVYPYDDMELNEITEQLESLTAGDFIIPYATNGKAYLQIKNWWKYQRPRWAWPSTHPAPENWQDRVCYRKGNAVIKDNWDQSETMPQAEPDTSESTAEPERNHDEPTLTSAPRISGSGSISTSGRDNEDDAANAAPPPPAPPKEAKKPARKKQPPLTEGQRHFLEPFGAKRYKTIAQRAAVLELEQAHGTAKLLEAATWAAERGMTVGAAVGACRSALPKWGQPKNKGSPAAPEPKGFTAIRAMMEKEGMTDGQQG